CFDKEAVDESLIFKLF
ncbi:hypothetical protein SOVF_089400, partial [Spinacia oleracea]